MNLKPHIWSKWNISTRDAKISSVSSVKISSNLLLIMNFNNDSKHHIWCTWIPVLTYYYKSICDVVLVHCAANFKCRHAESHNAIGKKFQPFEFLSLTKKSLGGGGKCYIGNWCSRFKKPYIWILSSFVYLFSYAARWNGSLHGAAFISEQL